MVSPQDRLAMLEAVFRDSPDPILVVEMLSGEILECNGAVRIHLGLDPGRLLGRGFDTLYATAAPEASLPERVQLHGGVIEERDLVRIDGSFCRMSVRAWPARWADRDVIIVILRDVRARRQAEAERRSAEAQYQSIFEHAVEGIFQTTPDGQYLSANPALARIYGYRSSVELIQHLTDIAGQLYVDSRRRGMFQRLLEEHDVVRDFESEVYRHDGSTTWISENARAVRDATGCLRYYEGSVIDISARKRAEETRRSEAEVAHALARVGREMIVPHDTTAVLARLSGLAAETLGCTDARVWTWDIAADTYVRETPGVPDHDHDQTGPAIGRAHLAPLLARLGPDRVLVLDPRSTTLPPALVGHAPPGELLCIALPGEDSPVEMLVTLRRAARGPVTDAQVRIARGLAHLGAMALERVRAMEKLERANRVKSEFVATISHELRTPLNIIHGYHEMLLDDVTSAEQRAILDRVCTTTRGLAKLINDTLDLSRLEAGTLAVVREQVVVSELLETVAIDLRDLADARPDVRLEWDIAGVTADLQTDGAKLQVVLRNLIHNALKFTTSGNVSVTATTYEGRIEFTIADTGIGIAPEVLAYVFESFRQGDGSATRRHDGAGLGLHVAQRLVELLGGSISVTSAQGVGSTFRLSLPQHATLAGAWGVTS
ncbi:MAG TPA: PAS domain S-box protein [Candidatus Binatia bacterium]